MRNSEPAPVTEVIMCLLLVHPSSLMYSEIFLRLEPLGLERVAGAAREAGHEVRVVDLQVLSRADLAAELASFRPGAIGISLNYELPLPSARPGHRSELYIHSRAAATAGTRRRS
jgi:hopanoid C-3 methylase